MLQGGEGVTRRKKFDPGKRGPKFVTDPVPTEPTPRKSKGSPATCIECFQPIDRDAVMAAIRSGRGYRHDCGRVLA